MTVDLGNAAPIDPGDPQFAPLLQNLQGNILKGHGRDHTVHVSLEFRPSAPHFHANLRKTLTRYATSAARQLLDTQQFKDFGIPGGLFGNVLLTASGYRALGFSPAQLEAAFPEPPGDFGGLSNFKEGMAAHAADLNDPPEAAWEPGYQGSRIDAMILLADTDKDFLLRQAHTLLTEVAAFADVRAVEHGRALRNAAGDGIEHFGYVDGRSQPIYLQSDLAGEGGIDQWNPSAPLGQVLVADRAVTAADSFGSYFVFRKLEQNVLHFKLAEQELADALGLVGSDRERAGAMVVGRFEDGTPVALNPTDGFLPSKDNNFQYDIDPNGLKCPFAAHIRKANPRGDIARQIPGAPPEDISERPRRMTRRGIPYGDRTVPPGEPQSIEDLPAGGVGLLFMCFGSSIANQFAFVQKNWVNSEGFVKAGVGEDPIIGQGGAAPQNWPVAWGGPAMGSFSFKDFVTLKGGEYFFAPSLPFLHQLAPPAAQAHQVVLSAGDPALAEAPRTPTAARPREAVSGRKR